MNKFEKLSKIVNKHIAEFTRDEPSIITNASDFVEDANLFSMYNIDVFSNIFNSKAPSLKHERKSLFHYKKFDVAYKFIEENSITASALSNFKNIKKGDDLKEYEHFFDVAKIGTEKSFIDEQRDSIFVFCLTNNNCTERFWKEYADNEKGLCLELEIIDNQNTKLGFDLKKICYDDGHEFQFFSDMQNELHSTFGRYLLASRLSNFAVFYKRKTREDGSEGFAWENETRLLLNCKTFEGLSKEFEIINKNGCKYMKIPFDNPLFSIKIKSVTIGKNLSPAQKQKIEKLLKQKNITIS